MTAREKGSYSLLGLAQKAGKVKSGERAVEASIAAGKAKYVLIATDASDNSRKQYRDKCAYYRVPCAEFGTREALGGHIGKGMRSAVAIEDEGFAKALQSKIDGGMTNGED